MTKAGPCALLDLLACPACHGDLRETHGAWHCQRCAVAYPIEDGIPIFVEAASFDHDELVTIAGEHHHGQRSVAAGHKAAQAAYFDRDAMADFEIERPSGAPPLYGFLLSEKFRRGVRPLGDRLRGSTALTVCGGFGGWTPSS